MRKQTVLFHLVIFVRSVNLRARSNAVESHYKESQGTPKILHLSEIPYNQLKYHNRTLTGSRETIYLIQKFTVRVLLCITRLHSM